MKENRRAQSPPLPTPRQVAHNNHDQRFRKPHVLAQGMQHWHGVVLARHALGCGWEAHGKPCTAIDLHNVAD
jgi:hypothetical protein